LNKAVARQLVEDVLIDHDFEKFRSYTDRENYTQHHPKIPDGVSILLELFKSTAAAGTGSTYDRIHMVLGEGNFVLVVSDGSLAGKPSSFYDLFRFENAKEEQ
jgi:predicted SnoaL-like aldol condensation-catalyzing enzyme